MSHLVGTETAQSEHTTNAIYPYFFPSEIDKGESYEKIL